MGPVTFAFLRDAAMCSYTDGLNRNLEENPPTGAVEPAELRRLYQRAGRRRRQVMADEINRDLWTVDEGEGELGAPAPLGRPGTSSSYVSVRRLGHTTLPDAPRSGPRHQMPRLVRPGSRAGSRAGSEAGWSEASTALSYPTTAVTERMGPKEYQKAMNQLEQLDLMMKREEMRRRQAELELEQLQKRILARRGQKSRFGHTHNIITNHEPVDEASTGGSVASMPLSSGPVGRASSRRGMPSTAF